MRLRIEARNAAVEIDGTRLVEPRSVFDRLISVPDGELRPGLINAHDHLRLNHFGRLGHGPYPNAYAWGRDIHTRDSDIIGRGLAIPRRIALLAGAWKNLLSGVTTVVHHDLWEPDFERDFPINVVRIAFADALGMAPAIERPRDGLFALHVAEGTDAAAAEEIRILAKRGLLDRRLIAVHAVGADENSIDLLRRSGCALVWCPTSNAFLFARTAPAALLAEGMDVLLGTDSLLTGCGDLLDELRTARGGALCDARLEAAVSWLAARRLGIEEGTLDPGAKADLFVLRRPLLDAGAEDVALVMAGGVLRVLDPALMPAAGVSGGQIVRLGNAQRWISEESPVREILEQMRRL